MSDTLASKLVPAYRWTRQRVANRLAIDTRSLAVFRILLGGLIIGDLLSRSRNFHFYYTDDGVVTQELAQWWTGDAFSIFYYTSNPSLIALLFAIHGLVALQLIVGYKTRFATVVSFLFVISLDHHNPLVLSYADTLFRLMFFWAIFLPLGERWSVDAVHRARDVRTNFVGLAGLFAMTQMIMMYFINGLNKFPSDLWQTGEGTPLVMGIDEMTYLLGDVMREFPFLLELGGRLWFYLLLSSPFLLLLAGRWRLPLIALFMGGHASFALTVRIGAFAYVALTGLVLFVQTPFWEDAKAALGRLGIDTARLYPSPGRQRLFADLFPSYSLNSQRNQHRKEDFYHLALGLVTIGIVITVAAIALSYGGVIHEDVPDDEERFHYTIDNTPVVDRIDSAANHFNVNQPEWSIFAGPDPRTSDRYYIFAAKTAEGEELDIYFDRELSYERPYQELQNQHETYRMRFYMNSIRRASDFNDAPDLLVNHLCETWKEDHDTEITHINIYTVRETITHETIDNPEDRDRSIHLVHEFTCSGSEIPGEFAPPPDDF